MTGSNPTGSHLASSVEAIRSALERVQKLCADSSRVLGDSLVGEATSSLGGSGETRVGLQGYIRETGELLSSLGSTLIRFKEQRSSRLEVLAAIQGKTDVVLKSSVELEKLGSQIKLLALNARIESARAGEAGVGFNVVATEVGDLGQRVLELTERIAQESADTVGVLEEGRAVIQNQDEEEAALSERTAARIGRIAADLGRMGSSESSSIDLSELTRRASEKLGHAVRALQFEDMVVQLLADVFERLRGLEQAVGEPAGPSSESAGVCSAVQQTSMDTGTIELF